MDILQKLNGIFRVVFEDDSIQVSNETTADDIEGWDSLSHINLIIAIEIGFNIKFSQKELLSFKNVGDLMRNVEGKIS